MIAKEVEASLDPANEGLVGVLLQTERPKARPSERYCFSALQNVANGT